MRRILHADQRLKQNHKGEDLPALHQEQFLLRKELGPMLNQGNIHSPIMKYLRNWFIFFVMDNMCIERMMEQFISGESKKIIRINSHTLLHWSDDRWKACLAAGGGVKRRFQYCTDASGTIVYFRALQGHSGRNLIDPSYQDNVIIQSNFFQHIYHIGCVFNLHSIINNGLIPGGQSSSKRQTVFFLPVDPMDESHNDPKVIDLNVQRHAQYLHNAWKRHQDAVNWVDINLAIVKGLTFYQTQSNAIILQETLAAYCIPKVVRTKTGEIIYEKVYMSPRPPPKISLKHEWKRKLGSEHAQRAEIGQLSRSFQSNQPILNPIRERMVRPDITHDVIGVQDERKTSRSQRSILRRT